jgi:ubiquitin C-terminal hydrolase
VIAPASIECLLLLLAVLAYAVQVDIRGFAEPMSLLSSPTRYSGKLPAGMLNHGNTCYLNAVLQVCWHCCMMHMFNCRAACCKAQGSA